MPKDLEFSSEQLERIDEIYNAADQFIRVMLQNYDMVHDQYLCGNVTDMVADFLTLQGFKVRYPAIVDDGDGKRMVEFHNEE